MPNSGYLHVPCATRHCILIYTTCPSDQFDTFSQVVLRHFSRNSDHESDQLVGIFCVHLVLKFYSDSFKTFFRAMVMV